MSTPSTANSKDSGTTVRPDAEPEATGRSTTHAAVKGEAAPRLPHERDESSDSGTVEPNERMKKGAAEIEKGSVDRERGPAAQKRYTDLTADAAADAETDAAP